MASNDNTIIGNEHDSWRAALGSDDCDCGCADHDRNLYLYEFATDDDPRLTKRLIGVGEARTAWLVNGVVYKVGRASANVYEHHMFAEWRAAGAHWAPATTLYRHEMWFGGEAVVIAMPYLPDDGGQIDGQTLAEIRSAAPETCRENYTSHGGHTWLIDGGDIQYSPAEPLTQSEDQ